MNAQTACALLSLLLLCAAPGSATERRFGFVSESSVLAAQHRELEPWVTLRSGRAGFHNRFENRLEMEFGMTDALQAALYFNWDGQASDGPSGRAVESGLPGASVELKGRMSDGATRAFGSAWYAEVSASPIEYELEAKLIADRRIGGLLLAANAIAEWEAEYESPGEPHQELKLDFVFGGSYLVAPSLSAGFEARFASVLEDGDELEHAAVFVGPVVSLLSGGWWITLSVPNQVFSPHGATDGRLDLAEYERLQARLLVGMQF